MRAPKRLKIAGPLLEISAIKYSRRHTNTSALNRTMARLSLAPWEIYLTTWGEVDEFMQRQRARHKFERLDTRGYAATRMLQKLSELYTANEVASKPEVHLAAAACGLLYMSRSIFNSSLGERAITLTRRIDAFSPPSRVFYLSGDKNNTTACTRRTKQCISRHYIDIITRKKLSFRDPLSI